MVPPGPTDHHRHRTARARGLNLCSQYSKLERLREPPCALGCTLYAARDARRWRTRLVALIGAVRTPTTAPRIVTCFAFRSCRRAYAPLLVLVPCPVWRPAPASLHALSVQPHDQSAERPRETHRRLRGALWCWGGDRYASTSEQISDYRALPGKRGVTAKKPREARPRGLGFPDPIPRVHTQLSR